MAQWIDYDAQIYPSDGTTFDFPERKWGYGNRTGVCFSGGGTRALSAAMGQLRALTKLKLIGQIDYISCVSGGSWAGSLYTYYNTGPTGGDAQFLGPVVEPQNIATGDSPGQLGYIDPYCLGWTATRNIVLAFLETYRKYPKHEIWEKLVGGVYLSKFGLFPTGPSGLTGYSGVSNPPGYFTLTGATEHTIKQRNPPLTGDHFNLVRRGDDGVTRRPYLIVNACLEGIAEKLGSENLVTFQYTPLYSGSPLAKTVSYPAASKADGPSVPDDPDARADTTLLVGGGFIESFAFGGRAPSRPASKDNYVTGPAPPEPFDLASAVGTSSSAFANAIAGLGEIVAPEEDYFPITGAGGQTTTKMTFGDGGLLENNGMLALLQRQVKKLVVFVNTGWPVNTSYDPSNPPNTGEVHDIDYSVPPLFGYPYKSVNEGIYMLHNQVFCQKEWAPFVKELQNIKKQPNNQPLILHKKLEVLRNDWWGIRGSDRVEYCQQGKTGPDSWQVEILWVFLDKVGAWETQLGKGIQDLINEGAQGPFPEFPNYATIGENPADIVQLTFEQVNLLADLTCWCVTSNESTFRSFLAQ